MKIIKLTFSFLSFAVLTTLHAAGHQAKERRQQKEHNAMLRNTYVKEAYIDLAHPNPVTSLPAWEKFRETLAQKAKDMDIDANGFEPCEYQGLENAIDSKLDEMNRYNSWTHRLWRTITRDKKPLDAKLVVPLSQLLICNALNENYRNNSAICINDKYLSVDSLNQLKQTILTKYFPRTQIKYENNTSSYPVVDSNLVLPNTYCSGIIDFEACRAHGINTFRALSPIPGVAVAPAVQYLPALGNINSHLSVSITRIPMYAKQFDLSDNHIAGYEDTKKTLSIYALPHAEKRYTLSTADDSMLIDTLKDPVITDAAWKHSFDKNTVLDTLSLCQKNKKLIYATHNTTADKTTSVITCGEIPSKPLSLLAKIGTFFGWQRELENKNSWPLEAHIKKIVEIDDSNFVCLTRDGDLYHLTEDGLKGQKLIPMNGTKFSDITIDPETNLCALQTQNKDIFTIDKKKLKVAPLTFCLPPEQRPQLNITSLHPELTHLIKNTDTVNRTLQCHNGHILVWKYNESNNKTTYTGAEHLKTEFAQ